MQCANFVNPLFSNHLLTPNFVLLFVPSQVPLSLMLVNIYRSPSSRIHTLNMFE